LNKNAREVAERCGLMSVKSKLLKSVAILAGVIAAVSIALIGAVFVSSINGVFTKQDIFKKVPKVYIVQSGSMEPALSVGSLLISAPSGNYVNNDIITFGKKGSDILITHRIYAKTYPQGIDNSPEYTTAGDANEDFDTRKIYNEDIIGKTVFSVPFLGYFANFAKTPQGFILLVIIPATIIIYEEFRLLKRETSKWYRKVKKKNQEIPLGKIEKRGLPRISTIVPITGALIVLASLSAAYLYDKEISRGNVFSAAESFGPPIAQTLVMNEFLWNSSCTPNSETKFWIELYNGYDTEVNIKNWRFTDNNDHIIQITNSNYYIQPEEYVLIAKSNSTFNGQCYSNEGDVRVLNLGGNPDFTPEVTGGVIKLERPIGDDQFEVVDRIDYGSGELITDTDESIQRTPNAIDTALGDAFDVSDFDVTENPTPGLPTP